MKPLILIALLSPLTAEARDLWCMPDRICIPGTCDIVVSEESSLRLTNSESIRPELRSHAETIPMSKTFEQKGISEWNGVNAMGEHEILFLDRDRMVFRYSIGGEFVKYVGREVRYEALGKCEKQ